MPSVMSELLSRGLGRGVRFFPRFCSPPALQAGKHARKEAAGLSSAGEKAAAGSQRCLRSKQ